MDLDLRQRTAIVTGAGSGIGEAAAKCLVREGVRVAIVARRLSRLEAVAAEIEATGGLRPVVISADLTDPEAIAACLEAVAMQMGPVDILVNSAGGSRPVARDAPDAAWDEAFALNFTAPRRLTEALLPSMLSRRWGRIINISGSMEPRSLNAASSAKAALHLWAKGLSCDVAAEGITINTIAPGRIKSEQIMTKLHPTEQARQDFISKNIPIGYFGEPDSIGSLVAFLASPIADYITGTVIPVDGGMHYFAH